MKTPREEMMEHVYAERAGIRLVSGVPTHVYRAALDEIRSLNRAVERLRAKSDQVDAFDVVLALLSYERDKCSNGAWARQLCRSFDLDINDVEAALWRRQAREEHTSSDELPYVVLERNSDEGES